MNTKDRAVHQRRKDGAAKMLTVKIVAARSDAVYIMRPRTSAATGKQQQTSGGPGTPKSGVGSGDHVDRGALRR
jgi:hypothetical protein